MSDLLPRLAAAAARPALFQPSDAPFWADEYTSGQLLTAHLNPEHDAASRTPAEIDATVAHLAATGLVGPGTRVLDLGCGPGLYAERLARLGCRVIGVDISERSLAYARQSARDLGLDIDYRQQDFMTLDEFGRFDLILQAYGELSTFSDRSRDDLLRRCRAALAPGGALVADFSTPALEHGPEQEWTVTVGGLWRPGPHLVLTRTHRYAGDVTCRQYTVVEEPDRVTGYRMWFHGYLPATLDPVLRAAGLLVEWHGSSLSGDPWQTNSPWLAVVARAT